MESIFAYSWLSEGAMTGGMQVLTTANLSCSLRVPWRMWWINKVPVYLRYVGQWMCTEISKWAQGKRVQVEWRELCQSVRFANERGEWVAFGASEFLWVMLQRFLTTPIVFFATFAWKRVPSAAMITQFRILRNMMNRYISNEGVHKFVTTLGCIIWLPPFKSTAVGRNHTAATSCCYFFS